MTEHIAAYIREVNQLYQTGITTEHSFRPALQRLLQDCTHLLAVNEQSHIECGAPDLTLLTNDHLAVAYVEAKDLFDSDLDGKKKNKEQFDRYKNALNTIVFTDYLDFHLYEDGENLDNVQLAIKQDNKIVLNEEQVGRFQSLIEKLRMAHPQKITSPAKLAKLMAGKARLMADAVQKGLDNDPSKSGSLWHQLLAFKEVLNKDLDEKRFADLYAQTIAYGLFAARIHDTTPQNFTRQEAASLIPHSNPFLRQIFQQLAGYDINNSIAWIVDDLVNIFAATDVQKLRKNFGKEMQRRDPMIHFYEDFLKYYDPESKKKYGVYYTPQPVVEFIVRAVDDILKTDFALPQGLADTSKMDVTVQEVDANNDAPVSRTVSKHRVQVLDPATGTGTFLAEVVNRIKSQQQKGVWPAYVDEHLIPRIYGFEYMMAPYTIAHLKLDMLINWWGEEALPATHNERLQIYLTNSLDQTELTNKHLLAEMIAREANEANNIKHNAPVMVMMGNPPYSVSSSNKSPWILNLLDDYKKNLNEKKLNLDDDYIKFIRLGQYYIERTGEGVLAYISNNSFIDGITHSQMRRELMRCFDDIYILDLHGNSRKKETTPDGKKDENVFSIMQGVSINIFVKKTNSENKPAIIHHYDLFGSRKSKYAFLLENTLASVQWQIIKPHEPNLFFVPKDFSLQEEYQRGFEVTELMQIHNSCVKTDRDLLFYDSNRENLEKRIQKLLSGNFDKDFIEKYRVKDSSSYRLTERRHNTRYTPNKILKGMYRPLDYSYIYYDEKLLSRPAYLVMQHMLKKNIAVIIGPQGQVVGSMMWNLVFVSDKIVDTNVYYRGGGIIFPLYLYPAESELGFETERKPNLDETIWAQINAICGEEKSPEEIFDYIYGVLHSPVYRTKYKEFLKVDFPRIPYPKDKAEFEHFVKYGHRLRELHLMHDVPESTVTFPNAGSMIVDGLRWEWNKDDGYSGNVWINDAQCFESVPADAWNFYIGGYQPAQKWLKDRKGRALSSDDVNHYRRIISVLMETKKLMDEIDK